MTRALVSALALIAAACAAPAPEAPPPPLASEADILAAQSAPLTDMAREARWNEPFAPFNVIGNIYYVGPAGVSSFLITTPEGHFLLDGALPQSAPQILANIEALGFDIRDVRYLLNSHAHWDHSGGLAALQRASGAVMVASEADREAIETGHIDYGPAAEVDTLPVRVDRVIADGETLTLGGVTLTALVMPAHTKGCTSWAMDVTGADGVQRSVLFHCSATTGGQSIEPPAYEGIAENYRALFTRMRGMQADIFLANHGNFFDLPGKRARQIAGDSNAFVDPEALQRFTAEMEAAFDAQLAQERAAR